VSANVGPDSAGSRTGSEPAMQTESTASHVVQMSLDLGTKLRETASNQCDDIEPVGHVKPSDLRFWDNARTEKLPVRSS
jgi:hypothetical protein